MKKLLVFFVLVLVLLSSCGSSGETPSGRGIPQNTNIKELSFLRTDDITLEVGKSVSSSYVSVKVKDREKFSPEDVDFISNNPDVAIITFTKDALTTCLYYEIKAVGAGETEVYAKAKDGDVESQHIKVTVPKPIEVESISIVGAKKNLNIGDALQLSCDVSPSKAADKSVTWTSSDESVVTINSKGEVKTIGGGTATISASSKNGVTASFDVNVDATKRNMSLSITHQRADDINIGDEWSYTNEINGSRTNKSYVVSVGDVLEFYSKCTESDEKPDIGEATMTHTITEEDFNHGFVVTLDVYVTENGGKNSGKSAHFVVTFKFS